MVCCMYVVLTSVVDETSRNGKWEQRKGLWEAWGTPSPPIYTSPGVAYARLGKCLPAYSLLFWGQISVGGNLLLTVSPMPAVKIYKSHAKMLKSTGKKYISLNVNIFLNLKLLRVTEQAVLHQYQTFLLIISVFFVSRDIQESGNVLKQS